MPRAAKRSRWHFERITRFYLLRTCVTLPRVQRNPNFSRNIKIVRTVSQCFSTKDNWQKVDTFTMSGLALMKDRSGRFLLLFARTSSSGHRGRRTIAGVASMLSSGFEKLDASVSRGLYKIESRIVKLEVARERTKKQTSPYINWKTKWSRNKVSIALSIAVILLS